VPRSLRGTGTARAGGARRPAPELALGRAFAPLSFRR
jgi:hypothetical protein